MHIILARHAARQRGGLDDHQQPLSETGRAEADRLATLLRDRALVPTRCFSSAFVHAKQTAESLISQTGAAATIEVLVSLTPKGLQSGLAAFLEEADGTSFDSTDVILVVAHEPRVSQLLGSMTSTPLSEVSTGQATAVAAPSIADIEAGRGVIEWRGP
jgi:phosphohistidine phosphatase